MLYALSSSYFEGTCCPLGKLGHNRDGKKSTLQVNCGLQMGLFDERNLFQFTHPDYPGERLVACRNAQLAQLRAAKRTDLLQATAAELEKVCAVVARGKLAGADKIGVRVGRVANKYTVAKYFELKIEQASFTYRIDQEKVEEEAALTTSRAQGAHPHLEQRHAGTQLSHAAR